MKMKTPKVSNTNLGTTSGKSALDKEAKSEVSKKNDSQYTRPDNKQPRVKNN